VEAARVTTQEHRNQEDAVEAASLRHRSVVTRRKEEGEREENQRDWNPNLKLALRVISGSK